jgi:small conductance mechanosensitive channel
MNTTLDPQKLTAFADVAWAWSVAFAPQLLMAVLIFVIGSILARWISSMVRRLIARTGRVDPTVVPVLGAAVRYSIMILVIVAALGQVGVQTASLLAVLGAAGLAIGLALQGTLTNISAGIMLLWLRPFHIGDYIEVNGMSGTVKEIGLFVCELETFDGIFLFAPNSAIWNNALKNHSRNPGRLVILNVTLSNKADMERARTILMQVAAGDERILKMPPPNMFVDKIDGANVVLNFRAWANHENVGEVQRTLIDGVRHQLAAADIDTLVPEQIARTVPPDSDPSRLIGITPHA